MERETEISDLETLEDSVIVDLPTSIGKSDGSRKSKPTDVSTLTYPESYIPPMPKVEPKLDPSYYEDTRERTPRSKFLTDVFLFLEMGVAIIALIRPPIYNECCGDYFFEVGTLKGQNKWDSINFWLAVGYMAMAVLQVPFMQYFEWPVFVLNPVIGYYLTLSAVFSSNTPEAKAMYALETVAVFLQSYVLYLDQKGLVMFCQSLVSYGLCGFILYIIVMTSKQGGFCIVNGIMDTLMLSNACNMECDDVDIFCDICDNDQPSCFITI